MKRLLVLIPLLAACEPAFDARRDYVAVAECYAAFMAVGMDAAHPDLGMDAGEQRIQTQLNAYGVSRLSPYTEEAVAAAGGDENFIMLAATWRVQADYYVEGAQTPQARQAAYQRVLAKAGECHELMTRWGAPEGRSVLGQ